MIRSSMIRFSAALAIGVGNNSTTDESECRVAHLHAATNATIANLTTMAYMIDT